MQVVRWNKEEDASEKTYIHSANSFLSFSPHRRRFRRTDDDSGSDDSDDVVV